MAVYGYRGDSDRYKSFYLPHEGYDDFREQLWGNKPLATAWSVPTITVDETESEVLKVPLQEPDLSDLCGGTAVFSPRACSVLEPLVAESVEALPINSSEGEYFLIHVLDVVDCLDRERSRLSLGSHGWVSAVYQYAFIPDRIANKHMFRIPETKELYVYVSDEFIRTVEENKLVGAKFWRLPEP